MRKRNFFTACLFFAGLVTLLRVHPPSHVYDAGIDAFEHVVDRDEEEVQSASNDTLLSLPPSPPPPSPSPSPSQLTPPPPQKVYKFFDAGVAYHDMNFTCPVPWEWTTNQEEAVVLWTNVLQFAGNVKNTTRTRGELYAFMSLESAVYYPYTLDVKEEQGYNFTVDYRIFDDHPRGKADIPAVYLTNPTMDTFGFNFRAPPKLPKRSDALMAVFIKNCSPRNDRMTILRDMMKGMRVHSYGGCENNAMEPANPDGLGWQEAKQKTASDYYFTFAAENSFDMSYVTEKVYDAFAAGSVPVYYGAPNINRFIPHPSSIINVKDFNSTGDLVEYLKQVAANETLYLQYFDWKKKPFAADFMRVLRLATRTVQCRMAMLLAGLDFEKDQQAFEVHPAENESIRWMS